MKVAVEVSSGQGGQSGQGLCLTCTRCEHQVNVSGSSERARNYGFVQLKQECPNGETNYYVSEGDFDE